MSGAKLQGRLEVAIQVESWPKDPWKQSKCCSNLYPGSSPHGLWHWYTCTGTGKSIDYSLDLSRRRRTVRSMLSLLLPPVGHSNQMVLHWPSCESCCTAGQETRSNSRSQTFSSPHKRGPGIASKGWDHGPSPLIWWHRRSSPPQSAWVRFYRIPWTPRWCFCCRLLRDSSNNCLVPVNPWKADGERLKANCDTTTSYILVKGCIVHF